MSATEVITDAYYRFVGGSTDVRRYPGREIEHALKAAGYVVVRSPIVAHKGPDDTDASLMLRAADDLENGYHIGGGNVKAAIIRLLREVSK